MKTNIKQSQKSVAKILFLLTLLVVTACSGRKAAGQDKAKVEAPSLDIHTAVVSGNLDALKQHVAAGSDLNEKDPYGGSSPLISAAVFGKPDAAKILIDAGADINFQNNDGSTALHTAAFFCRPEIVKMLLAKNADKTIKNKFGSTAYGNVAGPFAEVKGVYEMMEKMLGPMGLTLDYPYLEKTRPQIAALLK